MFLLRASLSLSLSLSLACLNASICIMYMSNIILLSVISLPVFSRVLKAHQLNKPAWFLVIEYRFCMVINLVDVAGCL